ncbi:MAG: cobalamin-dependent protein, partial [bacterium]|nr:cobalamin-dependent protein [bacterium]
MCAVCRIAGINVEMHECNINERAEQLSARIVRAEPEVVACSVYIWNVRLMADVCTRINIMLPSATIIWGGPEASYDVA